ncbi:RpiB/LacA/LacB family sugar-phosphate isomerase [Candidatus Parcubacteria bacterium]|nr:MAG: RpiB/LacA/LacB family sugar-phosphate isomerase [Candidatus Parcubacteria bacterium]
MKENTKKSQIYLGSDHNGFAIKEYVQDYLEAKGYKVEDLGNVKLNLRDDYPDYAKAVARKVQKSSTALGILFCGSGQGMCITANKFKGIRAALAWSVGTAKKSRYDDNSNIICLPAWSINRDQARRIITGWLTTDFSQATRHKRRIKKIY